MMFAKLKESQPPTLVRNFINAMRTIFPFVFDGNLRIMFFNDFVDHFFEKGDDTMLG
jgi:hypothetical protein